MPELPKRGTKPVEKLPVEQAAAPATTTALTVPVNVGVYDNISAPDHIARLNRFHGNAKNAANVRRVLTDVRDGDWYVSADGTFYRPVHIFILSAVEYWSHQQLVGDQMQYVRITKEKQPRTSDLRRDIQCLVLVDVGDDFVPALAQFRGSASPFAQQVIGLIQNDESRWWNFPAQIASRPRTSAKSGMGYVEATAQILPLTAALGTRLQAWLKTEKCAAELAEMGENFKAKLDELNSKCR